MKEHRKALPATASRPGNRSFGQCWLAQRLDEHPYTSDRVGVGRYRPVGAHEGHLESASDEIVFVERLGQIRPTDDQGSVGHISFKVAS